MFKNGKLPARLERGSVAGESAEDEVREGVAGESRRQEEQEIFYHGERIRVSY